MLANNIAMVSLVSAPSSAVHLEKSDEYLSEVWVSEHEHVAREQAEQH